MSQPVVIAGGGPVGLMLACELGLAGVETIVLERMNQPNKQSRGAAMNAGVVELLNQRGLMEALEDDGFAVPRSHFAHIWLDPMRLPDTHPLTFLIPHSIVERRLEERAIKLGVDVRRGVEVVAVAQDGDGVTIGVRTAAGEESIRGRYLVGCDGAKSVVRELAGIDFPGIDFPGTDLPFKGITGDLLAEDDDPLFDRMGILQQGTGFFTLVPTGPNSFRLTIGEFDVDPGDPDAPVTWEELNESVVRITGEPLTTSGTAPWLIRWTAPTRLAEQYRTGRVFLAGDAAHVHFPLGGQALSTGIEDAVNLGWKIAAEVNGWAPDGLLDTYHTERHPVGARACLTNQAQVTLLYPMSKVSPLRDVLTELAKFDNVNEYLVKMVGGLDVKYALIYPADAGVPEHSLLGTRLPEAELPMGAREVTVPELLHAGRGVLLDLSGDKALEGAAAGWADRVDVVTASGPSSEIAAAALLLRPDGRVAWAVTDAADTAGLETALRTWFGEPTPA